MERTTRFLRDDKEIHRDVEINRRYLDETKRVRDAKLRALLIEFVREEEEHQKRKIDLIRRALRRIEEIGTISKGKP
ncbi:MAG: hypothetical protein QMC89_01530 [Candidatus Hodarchaeaceae archaeon]|nr:hypothetical protein [Candidatus Hodarchaeaceae archaeon]